jgi:hypothetical protein
MMGVMEDLSAYGRVVSCICRWLKPGGRVQCEAEMEVDPAQP